MNEEIIYDCVALDEKISQLNAIKTEVEELMERLDVTVNRLNEGFISKSQKAFQHVHAEKRKDYELLIDLLTEMPIAIKRSADGIIGEDDKIAEYIRRRFL